MDDPKAIRDKAIAEAKAVVDKAIAEAKAVVDKAKAIYLQAIIEAKDARQKVSGHQTCDGFYPHRIENYAVLEPILDGALSILYKALGESYAVYFLACAEAKLLYEKSIAEAEAKFLYEKSIAEANPIRDNKVEPNRRYDSGRGLWL